MHSSRSNELTDKSELNQITAQTVSAGGLMAQNTHTSWFELVHVFVHVKNKGKDILVEAPADLCKPFIIHTHIHGHASMGLLGR